ncbi:MAG: hypothetical protein HXS48_23315 [Theionarchaea archaeon]|nr:MAG: hypothetical protein AYK19_06260 [Theionarchaea archaeon DG-70-1]MBU7029884.1 hypothetical protein [Theionarchaea archaeon]
MVTENDFFQVLGAKDTMKILEYLNQHGGGSYTDLTEVTNTFTVNMRLRKLLLFNLIQDHELENGEKWYSLTEKGQQIVEIMRDLVKLVRRCSNG